MNTGVKIILTAVVSAGVGGAIGYLLGSKKWKRQANIDISKILSDCNDRINEIMHKKEEPTTKDDTLEKKEPERFITIKPTEMGGEGDYTEQTLYLYENGVLTDIKGTVISQPETIIGKTLSKMGQYEPDALYVRDLKLNIDYEVLLQFRAYKGTEVKNE